jgi:predicted DNA-binding transcriptional regulator AlpA
MRSVVSAIYHRIRVSDDARYLAIGQVRERFGVSDMWVYRHIRDHGFPKPVRFGGKTAARHWLLSDIEQWEREWITRAQSQTLKA